MPGKNRPSKMIRKQAYEDVYKNKGSLLKEENIPYSDLNHRELYIKVYAQVYNSYHHFESIIRDMEEIYGK